MAEFIADMTPESIRAAVAEQYGKVAIQPNGRFPFPVGRAFAESLGYPPALLNTVPRRAVDAFAGISYPLAHADLQPGETALDLGCGAGMDTIIMGRQVGPGGHVHGLDLSAEMLECARANAAAAGLGNVTLHHAPAEAVPMGDGSVDVAVVNGIFNLCPVKQQAMNEVYRVLRRGGRLLVSEIVLRGSAGQNSAGAALGPTLEDWFQ